MGVKEKVLNAAEHLFAIQGYDKTSVQDIIDRAEVSKGGLYHHFDSKKEILEVLLQDFAKLLRSKYEELGREVTSISKLFDRFAQSKLRLPQPKQDVFMKFVTNPNEILIRERFLYFIRQQMIDPLSESITRLTQHPHPQEAAYLILNLTESTSRLPQDKLTDEGFMKNYTATLQQVIENMFD